jgi:hypothetical protein
MSSYLVYAVAQISYRDEYGNALEAHDLQVLLHVLDLLVSCIVHI